MTRNNTLILFTLIFFVSLTAQNISKKHNEENVEKELVKLTENLKLTDAQVLKLKPILENHAKERADLHDVQMKLKKRKMDDIQQVLTSEQKTVFSKKMKMRMEKKGQRFGGKKDGFKKLLDHLNLSDSQKQLLKATTEPLEKKLKADLSKAETREAKKALFESHRKALKDALDTILTDEQKENLKKFSDKRGKREKRKH